MNDLLLPAVTAPDDFPALDFFAWNNFAISRDFIPPASESAIIVPLTQSLINQPYHLCCSIIPSLIPPGEEFQAACRKGCFGKLQIMGQCIRVSGIVELAKHLGVRDGSGRQCIRQGEEMAPENRLGDFTHLEHLAGEDRFDERVYNVALPGGFVLHERRGARIITQPPSLGHSI